MILFIKKLLLSVFKIVSQIKFDVNEILYIKIWMNSKENTKRSEKVEAEKVIGFINHQAKKSFSDKENIIYNLSIGFTQGTVMVI